MKHLISLLLITYFFLSACQTSQESEKISKITSIDGLIALWDFSENPGEPRMARGVGEFPLREMKGPVERIAEGPLSGFSASMKDSAYFSIPYTETGRLNIHGKNQGVTVLGWVNWEGKTGFVGGMWNEYTDGGKRQYGLFVHLPHYNGAEQVCGHISWTGKPTPPFPYSSDYSASKETLTKGSWHFVAFTYEGTEIRSYLDGKFEAREPELIRNTAGFDGLPDGVIESKNPYYFPDGMGDNGSDFTVGAVVLSRGLGNFFEGKIGGLAVFDRALSGEEILEIHQLTMTPRPY
ncbi:LamG domain-containing protein [Lunatibacter salilacus]|uniref:LamG domain-containing protein n=1 Tax=Lunatibacter salilacus TaxID=2483804 RepID=UPI00131ABE62|nr:LamG domain-containing protein [Lunatibacter salilacus]